MATTSTFHVSSPAPRELAESPLSRLANTAFHHSQTTRSVYGVSTPPSNLPARETSSAAVGHNTTLLDASYTSGTIQNGIRQYSSSARYATPSPQTYATTASSHASVAAGSIVGERWQEHRIKVPKRVVREDVYEKIVRIPEKRVEEEVIEEEQVVRERIVEIAKPIIHERVVEVPEYEYVDKIVEVPEIRVQERIHQVPKVEVIERVQEVPKVIRQERIVEVPQIHYREVPVTRRVNVPQIQEEVVYREKPVPQYVERVIPEIVEKKVYQDIPVRVPKPYAAEAICQYEVPRIVENPIKKRFPLYIPKFVEKPVPRAFVDDFMADQAIRFNNHVSLLASSGGDRHQHQQHQHHQLAEIDELMREAQRSNMTQKLYQHIDTKGAENLSRNYAAGKILIDHHGAIRHQVKRGRSYTHSSRYNSTCHSRRRRRRSASSSPLKSTSYTPSFLQRLGLPSSSALSRLLARRNTSRRQNNNDVDDDDDVISSCDSSTSYCSSCSVCNATYDHMKSVANRVPSYPNT